MKAQLCGTALLLGLVQVVLAQEATPSQQTNEFECGGATVVIDSEPKGFISPEEAFVKSVRLVQAYIVVTRGDTRATFQSWRDIDFIGGICMEDAKGQPRIVYRAFCGGSGCNDQQWGIIDPIALRETLTPSDKNFDLARALLGVQPKDGPRLLSLLSGK